MKKKSNQSSIIPEWLRFEIYQLSQSIFWMQSVALINGDKKSLYRLSKIGRKVSSLNFRLLLGKQNIPNEQELTVLLRKYQEAFKSIDILLDENHPSLIAGEKRSGCDAMDDWITRHDNEHLDGMSLRERIHQTMRRTDVNP